jgi:hypothetical protein
MNNFTPADSVVCDHSLPLTSGECEYRIRPRQPIDDPEVVIDEDEA